MNYERCIFFKSVNVTDVAFRKIFFAILSSEKNDFKAKIKDILLKHFARLPKIIYQSICFYDYILGAYYL